MTTKLLLVVALLLPSGCTRSERAVAWDAAAGERVAAGTEEEDASARRVVAVTPEGGMLRPGANRVRIHVAAGAAEPVSVDVVAPRMPMHGVVRHPAGRAGEGWMADVEIPMPGDWLLYVNFDQGDDAVAVPFRVTDGPSEPGAGHAHRH